MMSSTHFTKSKPMTTKPLDASGKIPDSAHKSARTDDNMHPGAWMSANLMDTTSGVTINCMADKRNMHGATFQACDIGPGHNVHGMGVVCPVSVRIDLPLVMCRNAGMLPRMDAGLMDMAGMDKDRMTNKDRMMDEDRIMGRDKMTGKDMNGNEGGEGCDGLTDIKDEAGMANPMAACMMMDPKTGMVPREWQKMVGSVTVVRKDGKPLTKQMMETIGMYHKDLLEKFEKNPDDAKMYMNRAAFDKFCAMYKEMKGLHGMVLPL